MESVSRRSLFVPALPTLWPAMVLKRSRPSAALPFSAPSVRFFYFARNAVWLAAKMLRLDLGEVLVPAYHHGVEVEALVDAGAAVRFYPVGPNWQVDPSDVEKQIRPQTKALYLIHYAGFPGPAAQMRRLADERGLALIEDCALSLLSADGARPLGSTGDVGIFCLYKTLPVPNGGALVVNGPRPYSLPEFPAPPASSTLSHAASSLLQNLALRGGALGRGMRALARRVGQTAVNAASMERVPTGTQHFNRDHLDLGMSPLTLRIALAQDWADIVEKRRRNYFFLLGRLREVSAPLFHELPPGVCPLFYPLRVEDKQPVMRALAERGIESIDFWRHFHPACEPERFPEVQKLRNSILEIPCHQDLTPELMSHVAAAVKRALQPSCGPRASVANR